MAAWSSRCSVYLPLVSVGFASILQGALPELSDQALHHGVVRQGAGPADRQRLMSTSLKIAVIVTLISMIVGFFGALAFARYHWRFRGVFQKLILLPIFFPQTVLGLALLMWFNSIGMDSRLEDRGGGPPGLDRTDRHPGHRHPRLQLRPGPGGGGPRSWGPSTWHHPARDDRCPCCCLAWSRPGFSPSSSPGGTFRFHSSPPARIRPCPSGFTPRWCRGIRRWCRRWEFCPSPRQWCC